MKNKNICFNIGKRQFRLNCNKLSKKEEIQILILSNCGIPKINLFDMYDSSQLADIHLNIIINI